MFVITMENDVKPNPTEVTCNLVFWGIEHVPISTVQVVFEAVVIPVGSMI